MVPEFQVEEQLKSGQLIEVTTQGRVPVSLYWHSWNVDTELLNKLRQELIKFFN